MMTVPHAVKECRKMSVQLHIAHVVTTVIIRGHTITAIGATSGSVKMVSSLIALKRL